MKQLCFLWILVLGCSFAVFANPDVDQFINQLLASKQSNNNQKYDELVAYINQTNLLSEQKKADYFHITSRWFYTKKDFKNALKIIDKAIVLKRKYTDTSPEELKKSLYNKGRYQIVQNNISGSIKTFNELINTGEESKLTAKAYSQFGDIYRSLGDLNRAIDNFEKAERYFTTHQLLRDLYKNHLNVSRTYAELDRLKFANLIEKNLVSVDSISKYTDAKIDVKDLMITNMRLGNLNIELEKYNEADAYLKDAFLFAKKMKSSAAVRATILNSQGRSFIDQKRYKEAFSVLNTALTLAEKNTYESAIIKSNLALYYRNQSHFIKAEKEYLNAIKIITKSASYYPTRDELSNASNKQATLTLFKNLANNYLESHHTEPTKNAPIKALKAIRDCDFLLDALRNNSSESLSKLFWRAQSTEVYMLGVKIAYLLDRVDIAFYFMEKNKVLLLLEDLSRQERKVAFKISEPTLAREYELQQAIVKAQLNIQSAANEDTFLKDSLKNVLFESKSNFEKFKDSLKLRFPEYESQQNDISILKVSDVDVEILLEDVTIIEYLLDAEDGYLFFKSKEETKLIKLDSVKQLNSKLLNFKKAISQPFASKDDFKQFNALSQSVFKSVFKGIDNDAILNKQLVIIPDYYLSYIPFEVLQYKASDDDLKPHYLLDKSDISYLFSLSFQERNNQIRRAASNNLLAIAPVRFKNKELIDLGNSDTEINDLSALYAGDVLRHKKASKASFVNQANNYNIIHLATHAGVDDNQNAYLWFQDEKLSYVELHGIKTQASLVVLSACKTMQGELIKGEGLISLTRGFFSNGSKSVLSSLWNVNDKSNHDIMLSFYTNIKSGLTKDVALTRAKRDYITSNFGIESSPYYWASSIITGSTDTIQEIQSPFKHLKIIILCVSVLLIFMILLKHFKKIG